MNKLEEIQQIASQMRLVLDNPQSVKLQKKRIGLAQKQLRAIKKEINAVIRNINQQATQAGADSLVSVGLDVFGKRKWAGRMRAETRRAIEREKKAARQPYTQLKEAIDLKNSTASLHLLNLDGVVALVFQNFKILQPGSILLILSRTFNAFRYSRISYKLTPSSNKVSR